MSVDDMIAAETELPDTLAEMRVADAPALAHLCNTLAVLCEDNADLTAAILRTCSDLLMRQHVMLLQANLVPRAELQQSGSTH